MSVDLLDIPTLVHDCPECIDDISQAQARGVAPYLLYAYACENHVHAVRIFFDPEYAEWVDDRIATIQEEIGRLEVALDARERIVTGTNLLKNPNLTIGRIKEYQKRIQELASSIHKDLVDVDADTLRNRLLQSREDMLYWMDCKKQTIDKQE